MSRLFSPGAGTGGFRLFLIASAVFLCAAVLLWAIGWGWLRGPIAAALERATGRAVDLAAVDVDWNWRFEPLVVLGGLKIADAPWTGRETMLAIDRAAVRVRLWPLLRGNLDLPTVELDRFELALENRRDGDANWVFSPRSRTDDGAGNDLRLRLGALRLREGELVYRDRDRRLNLRTTIETKPDERTKSDRLHVVGRGTAQGEPLRLEAVGESLITLNDEKTPYDLTATLRAGATRISFEGALGAQRIVDGLSGRVRLSGDNLADIFPLTGVPTPDTPPYALEGRLWHHDGVWTADELTGKIGDSDLRGTTAVDTRQDPPFVNATLESRLLDFDDLGAIFGLPVRTGEGETASAEQQRLASAYAAQDRVLPNASLDIGRLAAANARLEFRGRKVDAPGLPLENVALVMRLEKRTLTFDPLDVGLRGGRVGGTVTINAQNLPVETNIALRVRDFDLQKMFPSNQVGGLLRGRFDLRGLGPSIREAAASAEGRLLLGIDRGAIDKKTLELIGLDLFDFLLTPEGQQERLSCAVFDLAVQRGLAKPETFLIIADGTAIHGEGAIDLGAERIDLAVQARDESATIGALGGPIEIGGTFRSPRIGLSGETIARGVAAAALGVLLTPIAALLATIEIGDAPDEATPCAALRRRAGKTP